MAPTNEVLSGMTSKQKVIGVVLLIIFGIIVWQIMGMFGSSSTPPASVITPTTPGQSAKPMSANQATMQQPGQPAVVIEEQPAVRQAPVPVQPQLIEIQKQSEQKYVDQLNQLQMLKIQREIAETNQAIASARLATVTAEKNVSDLLTRPVTPPQPQVPVGAYANTLVNPAPLGGTPVAAAVPSEASAPAPTQAPQYVVISVSMQLGKWSALLGYQGKLYHVNVGDVLSTDESVVSSIDKNGVVLTKDGKKKRISIIASI